MAMEKLYELHAGGDFDLVVVDTPPTRNALDFLDAPRRLTRFLDNRIFRLLMMPTRAYMKAMSVATQAFLRTVSKVVGTDVVRDAVAFFNAFEGMEQGFRERAQAVNALLTDEATAFVVVASPRRDAVDEALYFASRLQESEMTVDGLVVNRLHPRFGPVPQGLASANGALVPLMRNLADLQGIGEREESHVATLVAAVAPAPVARVPFLAEEVHDLDGLAQVGEHLFSF
jgi:anion-transporting  ArsA/GET3 family ATPase